MKYLYNILISILAMGLIQCDSGSVNKRDPRLVRLPGFVFDDWETLVPGYVYSDAPAADRAGNVYYVEQFTDLIFKITTAGEVSVFDEKAARTAGMMFAPDGRLIACRNWDAQIVAYDMQGGREVLLQGELTPETAAAMSTLKGEFCNGLVVGSSGDIWFNDRINEQVIHLDTAGRHRVVASGFRPNGIILSLDEKILVTTDSNEAKLWAFDVQADGSLREKPDFFDPLIIGRTPKKRPNMAGRPGTNGMTVDSAGRFYVTSFAGIQVLAPDGKLLGVMNNPGPFLSDITFAGENFNYLYATGRGGLYRILVIDSGTAQPANDE